MGHPLVLSVAHVHPSPSPSPLRASLGEPQEKTVTHGAAPSLVAAARGSSCEAVPHPGFSGCCWQQFLCSSPASAASQCIQWPLKTVKHLGWRCCRYGKSHTLHFTLIYMWMSCFAAYLCSDPSPNTSPSHLRWLVSGPMGP